MDEGLVHNHDVVMQSQLEVASSNFQMTNVEHQKPPSSPIDDIEHLSALAPDVVLTIVLLVVEGNEVINYSDIESYNSKRLLLRDSSNEYLDCNDKGVD